MPSPSFGAFFCGRKSNATLSCCDILFSRATAVFLLICAVAMGFALYTDHRWEDWYITYRASKNLALGHGLVFTVGERVHSFTSPIGTLIPALLAYLTHASDEWVIWLYRILSSIVLGLAGVQLYRFAQELKFTWPATILLLGLFSTNILIVDFTINGMETAFMMLLLIYFVRLLVTAPEEGLLIRFALVMAALIYTRPDSVIYAGAIGFGFFVAAPTLNAQIQTRAQFVILMLKAAGIAALIYLPWLITVWLYYGSPIPHTIIAKSGYRPYGIDVLRDFLYHPATLLKTVQVNHAFLPPYAGFEWHPVASKISKVMSVAAFFAFVAMVRAPEIQAISIAAFLCSFYLNSISGQNAAPWYLPNLGLMIILILALIAQYFYSSFSKLKWLTIAIIVILLGNSVFTLGRGAFELKTQQQLIEFGHRKQIGLWLKEHAHTPKDTVFMECLGYIGFYSEMKTYDYPGMSSPESVASIRKIGYGAPYARVIDDLKPDWVVLRPFEITKANADMPGMLDEQYIIRKEFNVLDQIPRDIPGYTYLEYDAIFTVFERKR